MDESTKTLFNATIEHFDLSVSMRVVVELIRKEVPLNLKPVSWASHGSLRQYP